ncbi:hypothetical protein PPERSA_07333 [Pseudocohnilembus persalinus]|uniref:Uncharacterized protein n=1 Tax=Pseudocohnilembus persalinus TaxID=266149 RepID=A0A0V0QA38_PSEPJ|nr:hypothetical protein PPERSA_07333 [Pseudocohnilembus persalinus]|eukprot:KRW99080.1 hypothetical protein PPERSA_07333 [Pseudocohnilembus persalinus]
MEEEKSKPQIYNEKLKQYSDLVAEEIKQIEEGQKYKPKQETQEQQQLYKDLKFVLEDLARTGEEKTYDWIPLRNFLVIAMKNMLIEMCQTYPDVSYSNGESFEDELEVILQFLISFETTPPFTLQRICELILDPKKHYQSAKKILFAIEKLVNVSPIEKSTLVF